MNRLCIICFLAPVFLIAQARIPVSKDDETILIFPEPTVEKLVNNNEFVIIPNDNGGTFSQSGRIIKIKGNKASSGQREATLLVITPSGQSYELILYPEKSPEDYTYYITREMGGMNILNFDAPKTTSSKPLPKLEVAVDQTQKPVDTTLLSTEQFALAKRIVRLPPWVGREVKTVQNIYLQVKGTYYGEDKIYIALKLRNESGQRYDLDLINFTVRSTYKRTSSNVDAPIKDVYVHNEPVSVFSNAEAHFVAVIDRFTLSKKREVLIEIKEKSGQRHLENTIEHKLINNPKRLKP